MGILDPTVRLALKEAGKGWTYGLSKYKTASYNAARAAYIAYEVKRRIAQKAREIARRKQAARIYRAFTPTEEEIQQEMERLKKEAEARGVKVDEEKLRSEAYNNVLRRHQSGVSLVDSSQKINLEFDVKSISVIAPTKVDKVKEFARKLLKMKPEDEGFSSEWEEELYKARVRTQPEVKKRDLKTGLGNIKEIVKELGSTVFLDPYILPVPERGKNVKYEDNKRLADELDAMGLGRKKKKVRFILSPGAIVYFNRQKREYRQQSKGKRGRRKKSSSSDFSDLLGF